MHVITSEIRKAPRVLENGTHIVELSESYKDREGNWQYTNYTFFLNAKSDGMRNWYADALQVGKVVTISFNKAKIVSREHNGNTYLSIQPAEFANLDFSQKGSSGQQQGGQQQQNGWGQPQQPQRQQQQQQARNDTPMNFDDDIPF